MGWLQLSSRVTWLGPKLMNSMPHTPPPPKVCETPIYSENFISFRNYTLCPSFVFGTDDPCSFCVLALPFQKMAKNDIHTYMYLCMCM